MLESYHSIRVAISHVSSEHLECSWSQLKHAVRARHSPDFKEHRMQKYFINNILVTVW